MRGLTELSLIESMKDHGAHIPAPIYPPLPNCIDNRAGRIERRWFEGLVLQGEK